MQLRAIMIKEWLLLSRDIHGLALLFVMPVVFILIMSLAMKADFDRRSGVQLDMLVRDNSAPGNIHSHAMLSRLAENPLFQLMPEELSRQEAARAIATDQFNFLLTISDTAFDVETGSEAGQGGIATVLLAPGNSPEMNQLFIAAVREAAAREKIILMLEGLKAAVPELADSDLLAESGAGSDDMVAVQYAGADDQQRGEAPTSVQQNVPAWLVFSMFFVVVPLANTLINERQLGTLRRLRTIDVPRWKLLAGKIIPYYVINQLQVVLMLLVGVYLVPLLGGDRLELGGSPLGLAVMASALSVAALGYGLLIAVIARTTEQATTLGGAGNIILAALGGIMVPTFVMPAFMQAATMLSPMSWGLQGFLDVLLRGGAVAEIWPEALSLLLLGLGALALALLLFHRHSD